MKSYVQDFSPPRKHRYDLRHQWAYRTAAETWSISCNGENRPVRFENAGTQTVVECGYDSLGRRFEKKVTVAGTLALMLALSRRRKRK